MDTIKSKTERLYSNAEFINNTGQLQPARYDAQLIYPLLDKPNEFDICINRFRIDLAGIPLNLGGKNIPFESWEVSLGYNDGTQWHYFDAFVPQFDQQIDTFDTSYCIASGGQNQIAVLNPFRVVESITYPNISYNINPVSETFTGTTTFYILNTDLVTVDAYQGNSTTPIESFTYPTLESGYVFHSLDAFCVDSFGAFYYACTIRNTADNSLNINIYGFQRLSATTWSLNTTYVKNPATPGYTDTTLHIETVLVNNGEMIIYTNNGSQTNSLFLSWNIGSPLSVSAGAGSFSNYLSLTNAGLIYRWSNGGVLTVSTNTTFFYIWSGFNDIDRFLGFDSNGYLLIHNTSGDPTINGYKALNTTTGAYAYTFYPTNECYNSIVEGTITLPIDNPTTQPIYTYQKYLNQINSALETSFNAVVAVYGGSYTPTQAPKVIYNGTDKLFQMIVEGAYVDSSKFLIDFNYNLNQLFLFNNSADVNKSGFYSIQVLNNYINAIVGNGAITNPQFLYVEQQSSTTYQFWNLARIIIATSKLGVNGDSEGTSGNNQILAITDVTPDTTELNPNSILIYSPFVLRFYQMYQTTALTRLDLNLQVGDKAGNVYPLLLQGNGGYASVKLEWRRTQAGYS
jgi:hypothetical protein